MDESRVVVEEIENKVGREAKEVAVSAVVA